MVRLDILQTAQQVPRWQAGEDSRHGIDKIRLVHDTHGRIAVVVGNRHEHGGRQSRDGRFSPA